MSERLQWLFALVFALGILDGALALVDRRTEAAREVKPGEPFVAFDAAGIAKIVVARSGKPPVVVARSAGQSWVVASSKNFPAKAPKVERVLARIKSWKRERVAGDKKIHDTYAVTPEKGITVKLEDFSGQTVCEFLMGAVAGIDPEKARTESGKLDPNMLGRYFRKSEEELVYFVQDFVTSDLEPSPNEWLDRPLTGDETKARALRLRRRTGEEVTIQLDPYPRLAADGKPLEPEKVKALVKELLNVNVQDTTDEDDAKAGLKPPALECDLALGEPNSPALSPLRLLLGDAAAVPSGQPCYAARVPDKPGPILVTQASVAQLVSATADSLALQHALGEKAPTAVTKASLVEGGRTITLAREGPGWNVTVITSGASPAKPVPEAKRTRAIAAALGLAVTTFDPRGVSAHGLGGPQTTLTVEVGGKHELFLGLEEGGAVWARRSDMACALGLSPESVAELRAAFAALAED
jgi:hypothetical protein